MAVNSKENMIRMNLYLPKQYREWLEKKSSDTGITMSAIMVIALKTYMDQQDTMELMPKMLAKLNELESMSKEEIESVKELIENSGLKR